jgi:hypothetical protein
MTMTTITENRKMVLAGRILSGLVVLPFIPSGLFKFMGSPDVIKGFADLGLPLSMRLPLGILETLCVVIYCIPRTATFGAILMTGYIGGAMLTHLRVGQAVWMHIVLGIVVWLGLWLRDARLREILPLRK